MPLSLFLARHGAAQNGTGGVDPSLSDAGAEQVRTLAEALRGEGVRLDLALASPLARAQQTASIAWGVLGGPEPIRTLSVLSPNGDPSAIADAVSEERIVSPDARCILLVGHMPVMPQLARFLVGNPSFGAISFVAGGIRRVDCDGVAAGAGTWVWSRVK